MGSIHPRLARLYDATNPGTPLPLIITTQGQVQANTLLAARQTGARVGDLINFGNGFTANANLDQAQRLANLPGVTLVSYDEPITSFPGAPRV